MILKLSNLPEKERKAYFKLFEIICITTPYFTHIHNNEKYNSNGLRYDVNYLNGIGKRVVLLPLEIMANYVDVITKGNIDRNDTLFIKQMNRDLSRPIDETYVRINATSIGNIAYAALNVQHAQMRVWCEHILNLIHERVINELP